MRINELKELLKKENLDIEDFNEWIYGQTMGLDENGEVDIYDHDVYRYIGIKKHGERDIWD